MTTKIALIGLAITAFFLICYGIVSGFWSAATLGEGRNAKMQNPLYKFVKLSRISLFSAIFFDAFCGLFILIKYISLQTFSL